MAALKQEEPMLEPSDAMVCKVLALLYVYCGDFLTYRMSAYMISVY